MAYGSSPYLTRKFLGVTGNTGSTGNTGPAGNLGATGPIGSTGNTGAFATEVTFTNTSSINTIFSNGEIFSGVGPIIGSPGNYYVFASGATLATNAFDVFQGVSFIIQPDDNLKSVLKFRGFTTSSKDENKTFISINTTSNEIGITYSLEKLPYLGISGGSTGQLVVRSETTNTFYGLTGTNYNSSLQTVDMQVLNYGERVHFVEPVQKSLDLSGQTNQKYFIWNIDWEVANTFVLNSWKHLLQPGTTPIAQIVLVRNSPSPNFSKSVTIIAPTGITGSDSVTTVYVSASDLNQGYTLNYSNYSNIIWPLTYPPCLTNNTDVINMISLDGLWYANYGIYDSNQNIVDWNSNYNDCAGSRNPLDPESGNYTTPPDPVQIGICCNSCDPTNPTFVPRLQCNSPNQWYTFSQASESCLFSSSEALGVCCYTINGTQSKDERTQCGCSQLNGIWTAYNNCIKNVNAIDCIGLQQEKGACCLGNGNCTPNLTNDQCLNIDGYWQGPGKVCSYSIGTELFEVCKTGTGGCCDPSTETCTDVNGVTNCTTTRFYGCGITCSRVTNNPNNYPQCDNDSGPRPPQNGACCSNVQTGCYQTTQSACQAASGGVFYGVGVPCGTQCNPAPPLTGACCRQGSPCNITTEADCESGDWREEQNCNVCPTIPPQTTCSISTTQEFRIKNFNGGADAFVKIGDEFAGGIVVGMFNPKGARCFGNTAFGGPPPWFNPDDPDESLENQKKAFEFLNSGTEKECGIYFSQYEPWGYGFTLPANHNGENDSWLLIVSPYNVRLETNAPDFLATDGFGDNDASITAWTQYYPYFTTSIHTKPLNLQNQVHFLSESGTNNGSSETASFNSLPTGLYDIDDNGFYYYVKKRQTQTFVWSHGGTAFCPTLDDNFDGIFEGGLYLPNESDNTSECLSGKLANIKHEGSYGTLPIERDSVLGNTYFGNTTTFDGCNQSSNACISQCAMSPSLRTRALGSPFAMTRSTGWWSRNWGIYNSCRLFSSDVAEYFLRSNSEYASSGQFANFRQFYGMTGAPANGVGNPSRFSPQYFSTTIGLPGVRTTIAEATSAFNRHYYKRDDMASQGFPQVSRWYIPSADELAFIANACIDSNINLQSKIYNWSGGDESLGAGGGDVPFGIPIGGLNNFANGWVWTSTGSFDEGITQQYIQATGGLPFNNNNSNGTTSQITCNKFTKAWAMKFPQYQILNPSEYSNLANQFRIKKADDLDDKYEVRPVRLVRCDQKYYNNSSPEYLRNSVWHVPVLTDAAICNGRSQNPINSNATQNQIINGSILFNFYIDQTILNSDSQTQYIFKNQSNL